MTPEVFKQLAQKTYSFSQLPAEEQQRILKLTGPELQFYIDLFQEENAALAKAADDFRKESDDTIADFTGHVKKTEIKKRLVKEKKEQGKDEQLLNNLLNKI